MSADTNKNVPEVASPDQAEIGSEILAEISEITERLRHERPMSITQRAGVDLTAAIEEATKLQEASIRLTYASDWIVFQAQDGAQLGYLQDVGCQRVTGLWGITFDKPDLRGDFDDRELSDGSFLSEVQISGACARTGTRDTEIGIRSSIGFFEKAWDRAQSPVAQEMCKSNIRKAAMANGQGRLVRRMTGMGQIPKDRLVAIFGAQAKNLRGVTFRTGGEGGGQGAMKMANDGQLRLLGFQAIDSGKVAGLRQVAATKDALLEMLVGRVTSTAVSKLIDKLKAGDKNGLTVAEFEHELGVRLIELPAADDGPPPPEDEA